LGFETAKKLLEKNYIVYLGCRNLKNGEAAVSSLNYLKGQIHLVQIDVSKTESVEKAFVKISKEISHLDVLINNAGINSDFSKKALDADIDKSCHETFEINFFGSWRMIKTFHPLLKKSEAPRIVNVSSGLGSITTMGTGYAAYGISKAAMNGLTKVFAEELAADNILVNSICPGWCATEMGGSGGRAPELGAECILWGVELPDDGPTGGFFRDGQALDW
jgi:NAD(P)-dependent dehydrogenase (short-subunit alcohol dehydrogenase family)